MVVCNPFANSPTSFSSHFLFLLDFIAVRDMRNDTNLSDDFVMESIMAQKVGGGALKEGWQDGVAKGSGGDWGGKSRGKTRDRSQPRPKEVGLKIDLDADYF
jgi:hypothetical protein